MNPAMGQQWDSKVPTQEIWILGRLEMCYDGYWGSVCNDYSDHVTLPLLAENLDIITHLGVSMCQT